MSGSQRSFLLVILLGLTIFMAVIISSIVMHNNPALTSINPKVGEPGEPLEIFGQNFGKSRNGGEVRIGNERLHTSIYEIWSDDYIRIRIPDEVRSGIVQVITKDGHSNGLLFTNRKHIPQIIKSETEPGIPTITSVSPDNGSVGTILEIIGSGFGSDKDSARVLFPLYMLETVPTRSNKTEFVEPENGEILSWSDRQVRLILPDGVTSGILHIVRDEKISNGFYLDVDEPVGTRTIRNPRGYEMKISIKISNIDADNPNTIDLWLPNTHNDLRQRNSENDYSINPIWQDYHGISRFRLENVKPWKEYEVSVLLWIDCFEYITQINTRKIKVSYDTGREMYIRNTNPDKLVPSDEKTVTGDAKILGQREKNWYLLAQNIFAYVLKKMHYTPSDNNQLSPDIIRKGEGNAFHYALYFSALCRAAGIPARPVAGFLIYDNREIVPHAWAEFYLEGFGWVPVDAFLADNPDKIPVAAEFEPSEYYFGSIDHSHVSFTHGIVPTVQFDPASNIKTGIGPYSLQAIYEESSATIYSYTSDWDLFELIDIW